MPKVWGPKFTAKMAFINLEKLNSYRWVFSEMELLLKDLSFSLTRANNLYRF